MRTVSPPRTSLRRTSSSLWRLTLRITTPASSTGSSFATGVSAPVLPTFTSIAWAPLVACPAGRLQRSPPGVGPGAGPPRRGERLPVRGEAERVGAAHVVEEDVERPARGDRGVLLADRARRRGARGGEGRLPGVLELPGEPRELGPW